MKGQVVDTESAREFMQEARKQLSGEDLAAISAACARKAERFRAWFGDGRAATLTAAELDPALASVFAARRRRQEILAAHGASLGGWVA